MQRTDNIRKNMTDICFPWFMPQRTKMKAGLSFVVVAAGLGALWLCLWGFLTPSYSEEVLVPTFGEGKVKVMLYTDYFCTPCRKMESDVEPLLRSLMERKVATITLVDTPFSKLTPRYARYFLYALNARKDFEAALAAKRALDDAASQGVESPEKLEAFLKEKGIPLKPYDPKPSFLFLSNLIKANDIKTTPTCVIEKDGKKETFAGGPAILKALKELQ
jgi:hypothetical protein